MKRIVSMIIVAVMSTCSFATAPTSSANKSSPSINSLGSAWKSYRPLQPKERSNEMEIVYGGEDVKTPALIQVATA